MVVKACILVSGAILFSLIAPGRRTRAKVFDFCCIAGFLLLFAFEGDEKVEFFDNESLLQPVSIVGFRNDGRTVVGREGTITVEACLRESAFEFELEPLYFLDLLRVMYLESEERDNQQKRQQRTFFTYNRLAMLTHRSSPHWGVPLNKCREESEIGIRAKQGHGRNIANAPGGQGRVFSQVCAHIANH